MILLVLSCALFAFAMSVLILAPLGQRSDLKQQRIKHSLMQKKIASAELDQSFYARFIAPAASKINAMITKITVKSRNGRKSENEKSLAIDLHQAGIAMTPEKFNAVKTMAACLLAATAFLVALLADTGIPTAALAACAAALAGLVAPRYIVRAKIQKRQSEIRNELPEIMDLLCVSMEAGLGFDAAVLRITEKNEGALVDELTVLIREIQMGKLRRDALKDFGMRSNVPELKTFASAVIQADSLGITIKNVLQAQSEQLRTARRQMAQEKGMKAPVKMMIPMVLLIFPVLFIILLGPSIIQIMNEL